MLRSCAAALTLLASAGCGTLPGTLDEAGELLAEGGERVLREPMRPARGAPRVLVIALDGVGQDRLAEALAAGDLPHLSALLGASRGGGLYDHGVQVRSVPSVFPSETAAGWAAVYTGRPPAETGVTGNEWFDRDSLRTFAPVPISVESREQALAVYTDRLLGRVVQTPTVFERAGVRSHVALGSIYRGADLLALPDLGDVGDLVSGAVEAVFGGAEELFETLDHDAVEGVERGAERYGLPDLQVAYFPGVDLVAHASGGAAQRAYLRDDVDAYVGEVLDVYRARGALAGTTVVVVSDHGHVDTLDDDRHSLDAGGPDEPPALLDSLGYRLRDFSVSPDSSDADVVMVYNEAVAALYVANGATCAAGRPCDWTARPRLRDDVLPLARALRDAGEPGAASVGGLAGALDLVLVRASDPSGRTSPPFRVLDGDRVVPVADYLRRSPRPDLVDLERRLGWLTDGPLGHRAGDVLLLAKSGEGRPLAERFYFGPPRRSGHGGASADQSYISLLVARPGASGPALRDAVRQSVGDAPTQLDVAPLILSLLNATP